MSADRTRFLRQHSSSIVKERIKRERLFPGRRSDHGHGHGHGLVGSMVEPLSLDLAVGRLCLCCFCFFLSKVLDSAQHAGRGRGAISGRHWFLFSPLLSPTCRVPFRGRFCLPASRILQYFSARGRTRSRTRHTRCGVTRVTCRIGSVVRVQRAESRHDSTPVTERASREIIQSTDTVLGYSTC